MSWWAGLARRLHLRLGESATNGTLRRMVTKHCKVVIHKSDVAPKRSFVLMVKHRFDQIWMARYFFFVLLLLPSVARAQETHPNPSEAEQHAKPAETVPIAEQVVPAQSQGLPEEHPRLFWIIPTYKVSNSKAP